MDDAWSQVSQGKGFHLVRGFPVAEFKDNRVGLVLAFWSLALHLGRPLVRARIWGLGWVRVDTEARGTRATNAG